MVHMLLCHYSTREGLMIKEKVCVFKCSLMLTLFIYIYSIPFAGNKVPYLLLSFCFNNACKLTDPLHSCREHVGRHPTVRTAAPHRLASCYDAIPVNPYSLLV